MPIKLYPPLRVVSNWGSPKRATSLNDIFQAITRTGQGYYDNYGRACDFVTGASCDISIYEYWGKKGHGAEDIPCPRGTEIYAMHDGEVVEISNDLGSGLGVVLWNKEWKIKSGYWHFLENKVKLRDKVKTGDLIGLGDSTGISYGNHLHVFVKETDELGNTINNDNGYGGAIPFRQFLSWFENDMKFVKVGQEGTDVWLVNNDKRSLVYNALAFTLVSGNWADIEVVTQVQLDAIPDTGKVIAGLDQQ